MEKSNSLFEEDLQKAVECIKKGGVILYPTDTIWGLGCDATNPDAVKKIYDIKKRDDHKSMLVLTDSIASLEKIIEDVPEIAFELINVAVKPLTIIYEGAINIAPNLLADDGSLGVRITSERFSKELCFRMKGPVVSTSANISGSKSPANFHDIDSFLKEQVDYVVSYRQNENKETMPSNIIKLGKNGLFKIIR